MIIIIKCGKLCTLRAGTEETGSTAEDDQRGISKARIISNLNDCATALSYSSVIREFVRLIGGTVFLGLATVGSTV